MKNDSKQAFSLARTDQLIIKEVDDEVLVYDLKTDQAHCLNKTAGLVWQNCDGKKSVTEINACLAKETGLAVDEQIVWLALDELEKFKLLEGVPAKPIAFVGMSRRQLIRNIGIAAVALPVIVSIISPIPAMAASPCMKNDQCTSPGDCCAAHPVCSNLKCTP